MEVGVRTDLYISIVISFFKDLNISFSIDCVKTVLHYITCDNIIKLTRDHEYNTKNLCV